MHRCGALIGVYLYDGQCHDAASMSFCTARSVLPTPCSHTSAHALAHRHTHSRRLYRIFPASGATSLAVAFKLFEVIHRITTTHEAITAIAQEVCMRIMGSGRMGA